MSNVPDHIIKEAVERGLVEGVRALSVRGNVFTVPSSNDLYMFQDVLFANDPRGARYAMMWMDGTWATPIKEEQKPEPSMPLKDVEKMVSEMVQEAEAWFDEHGRIKPESLQPHDILSIAKKYGVKMSSTPVSPSDTK
jgi:hypothetical protein